MSTLVYHIENAKSVLIGHSLQFTPHI